MATIFDRSCSGKSAFPVPLYDIPDLDPIPADLLSGSTGLVEVDEVDVVRHYTNLSRMNYSVDTQMYPLGSCTMKYNPKMNERLAALPGFTD
ncbi:MAG: aminomethyl-transferring glycine dehydrogenase subunit GcvPB, partial [Spirochaetes bacterium]|nr:aminomethyl-transferring glycine dehydrogenase subunit GcvPB [Spirochaetota bacterium]